MIYIIAFFAPLVAAIVYGIYSLYKEGPKAAVGAALPDVFGGLDTNREGFLINKFPYYKALSAKGRHKFMHRYRALLNVKEFIGGDGFTVTDEMRYYIIACWVQVTYGLERFHMPDFQKIIVFESTFYSRMIERQVKGLTSNAGFIYLSWEDFVSGYENPKDNYNLGIHELSHAFLLSTYYKENFDINFSSYIDEWFEATKLEFDRLSAGIPSYLREYAGTNSFEFFAVCMENFFETPEILKEKIPGIYYHLCYLLNQDPLNTTGDYSFEILPNTTYGTTIELPKKQARSFKYTGKNYFKLLAAVPCFLFILTLQVYFITYITFLQFLLLFLAGLSLGMVKNIRERIYRKLGPETGLLIIVTCMGFGLVDLVIGGNYCMPVSDTKVETYKIVGYENKDLGRGLETIYVLENDALKNFTTMRSLAGGNSKITPNADNYLQVYYYYGIFGLKVFEYNVVTTNPSIHFDINTIETYIKGFSY